MKSKKVSNKIKRKGTEICFDIILNTFLILLALVMVYPLLYVLFASVSEPMEFMKHNGMLWHSYGFTLDSYKSAFENPLLLNSYKNTLIVMVVGVILNLLLTSFGAFFLTQVKSKLNKFLNIFIIITMFFSGGMIPFYFVVRNVGLSDSLWSLILPAGINTFNLIILKVAFAGVPDGIVESAKIDGAGHWTVLFRIILPVTKASLAVIALYYAVQHWNSWFNAMLFIDERNKYPLQLILREILISSDTSNMTLGTSISELEFVGETIKYAVIIISTLPILCIYPFLQKYFAKGTMVGAVKG